MSDFKSEFLDSVKRWIVRTESIQSAVQFGSSLQSSPGQVADDWSDIDLHLATSSARELEHVAWLRELPSHGFRFQVVRAATGGVRKATVLFESGQIDLVIVPISWLRVAKWGLRLRLNSRVPLLQTGLNEISTCLKSGYRFLKGEKAWGQFYTRVARDMPGVRLTNEEARKRADVFLCDLLWVLQKLKRGELAAAQHVLHRSLAETNFALLRELRLRTGQPLPSFGLGRRVESLLPHHELTWVQVDAKLERDQLAEAAWRSLKV